MSTKSGRGGRRPGAGRKPRGYVKPLALAAVDLAHALAQPAPDEIEPLAQRYAGEALESLVKQLTHGTNEMASVTAANALLDRGYGKPAADIGGTGVLPFLGHAPSRNIALEIRETARHYAPLAIATLRRVANAGRAESARVAASKSLWDRGIGAAPPAKVDSDTTRLLSKKEQAALAAKTAAAGGDVDWGDDLQDRKIH